VAQADLENGIGLAYLTNYIDVYAQGDHPRYLALVQELYACLENYLKQAVNTIIDSEKQLEF
jgi:hypothetical protein